MSAISRKVVIGVCARNEESCICSALDSIMTSANIVHLIDWSIVVCANGCSDNTIPSIETWRNKNPRVHCVLLVRKQGSLIEAQREIFNYKERVGASALIFFGADIILDNNCIGELLKNSVNNRIQAAYAISIPIHKDKETLIEKALNQYDISPTIFSPRKHLHGRAFLIKDWNIPQTDPPMFIDDMYLSFYLLKKYGPESIAKVNSAKVYFHQIASYKDFFNTYRRRSNELKKTFILFPNLKLLPADQINRIILWKKLLTEPPRRIAIWCIFLGLRKFAYIHNILKKSNIGKNWIPASTTKISGIL